MTTIAAVQTDEGMAVAWDTLNCIGPACSPNETFPSKILQTEHVVVGVAGLSLYQNLLCHYAHSNSLGRMDDESAVFDFFLGFWKALRDDYHFVNDQADQDDPSPFADLGAEFIVVTPTAMFKVKEILSVRKYERFCVIGSGASHAEGALEVLHGASGDAVKVATQAVSIASMYDRATGSQIESAPIR